MIRLIALCSIFALGGGMPLSAQTPEEIARDYAEKFANQDYLGAALLTPPSALGEVRDMLEMILELEPSGAAMLTGMGASQIEEASDEALFAGFFRNTLGLEAGLQEAMGTLVATPIGHLTEGDTIHVVLRSRMRLDPLVSDMPEMADMEPTEMSAMEVVSLLTHDGELKVLLSAEVQGMVDMMRQIAAAGGGVL